MVYKKFVHIGGVVFIVLGPHSGKLATVVNVVDQNRLLVDGPCSDVPRVIVNLKQCHLTKFSIPIAVGARTGVVKRRWEKESINEKWAETAWAKKIQAKAVRKNLTDFDRFKLMKLKRKRNLIINAELKKMGRQAKKN
ncbi:large ribosomal subunit protein eL14-like [Styela clava]|uniref:60S ribosomal protein L14-like n=1 Tax=Styela clava TaxID=7725 RepID=UPI001939FB7C|nr:60S ribosomal protein L14-like [Styela clava]